MAANSEASRRNRRVGRHAVLQRRRTRGARSHRSRDAAQRPRRHHCRAQRFTRTLAAADL